MRSAGHRARGRYTALSADLRRCTVSGHGGSRGRDPGYDDWFDEPEPPTETQSGANRGVYEDAEEVWVLPEEDEARAPRGQREIVIGGRTLTTTQVAIIALSVLALFFAILAAFGVFNGSKAAAPPVTTPHARRSHRDRQTTTPTTTTADGAGADADRSSPATQGAQVKILQQALTALGFSAGTADGDYGPATQNAVERFQVAKNLGQDGVVGPADAHRAAEGAARG